MELKLLLDLDVVSNLSLVLLELLLILLWGEINALESARKACIVQITARDDATSSVSVQIAVSQLI